VERLVQRMGNDLSGRKIAVWGLAFKPNTDDMREATSRVVIRELLKRGAQVSAYDPVAGHEAMKALRLDLEGEEHGLEGFELVATDMQALEDADALMVLTEWKNFHNPDFLAMKELMRYPLILDGRNLYNPEALRELGMAYQGVGRRNDVVLSFDPVQSETLTFTRPVASALMHA
jgi:UDPglucose 6-dehydrogenase